MHRRALSRQPMPEEEAIERIEDEALGPACRAGHGEHVRGIQAALAQARARERAGEDTQRGLHRRGGVGAPITA